MPRDKEFKPGPNSVFVFGSNTAGIHGAGAAKTALDWYGAIWGRGEGMSESGFKARSYAIPTKDHHLETLPIEAVRKGVQRFLSYAASHSDLRFFVTRIGCGLAGFTDAEIGPMFVGAPDNVELPYGWGKEVFVDEDG